MFEKCTQLSDDKVNPDDYVKFMNKQLEKYKLMTEKIDNYDLN